MGRYDELDEAQWYALRVVPQKEYTVAWMLERRDVWAYVPTGTTWRRRTRYAKAGAEYAHPERPGLIFARFTTPPAWYNVLKNHLILGAIGRNGEPWQFRPRELYEYFARVPNGTLVHEDGEAVVKVNGRSLRAPTTQTRFISKHRKGTETVVEPTRQEAELLTGLLAQNASPQLLRAAA
jgi:hypothetical protein